MPAKSADPDSDAPRSKKPPLSKNEEMENVDEKPAAKPEGDKKILKKELANTATHKKKKDLLKIKKQQ